MTIDELCRNVALALVPSMHPDETVLAARVKAVIGPELADRDAEIKSLRSQLASAWAVIKRQHDAGLRDKPEVSMERADLDAAIAGVCAARDAEIDRLKRLLVRDCAGRTVTQGAFNAAQSQSMSRYELAARLQSEKDLCSRRIAELERENAELRKDAELLNCPLQIGEPNTVRTAVATPVAQLERHA